ncbi:MAG TPA: methyltransferase domain-containing protein [Methylomirabilota bacterium]
MGGAPQHPDVWRAIDAQPTAARLADTLEVRGRTPAQARLRRRFLRFVPIRPGQRVLEIGCGTGVVLRDLMTLVGRRGEVTGLDSSRTMLARARALARGVRGGALRLRHGDGNELPFAAGRFDVALAVTVILHVADPLRVVKELVRVTRAGGRVGVQDQDFGLVGAAHPDRTLTDRILDGVAARIYEEPYSGRRLPVLLREAGLEEVRVLADVYQDTALSDFSRAFLERRAENAVRFGIVDPATATRWLDGFNEYFARGAFVLTMNYFGAVGVKR